MEIVKAPKPKNPVLFEKLIGQLQDVLVTDVTWLTHVFGLSQKMITEKGKKKFTYPGVHIEGDEYIKLFPDDKYGNFSFFTLEDAQEVKHGTGTIESISARCSLTVWLNLNDAFPDKTYRNPEVIKLQLLKTLSQKSSMIGGRLNIVNIYEASKDVYKGYDISEAKDQYSMMPYTGFRIEFDMRYNDICSTPFILSDYQSEDPAAPSDIIAPDYSTFVLAGDSVNVNALAGEAGDIILANVYTEASNVNLSNIGGLITLESADFFDEQIAIVRYVLTNNHTSKTGIIILDIRVQPGNVNYPYLYPYKLN